MPDDRVKKAKLAAAEAGVAGGGIKKKERASAITASQGGSSAPTNSSSVRDRSNCRLLKREGDPDPKSKTAVFTCAGCGAVLTGFTAWRNHMKKSSSFKKCALPPHSVVLQPSAPSIHVTRRRALTHADQEHGALVHSKRRLSMRPAEPRKPVHLKKSQRERCDLRNPWVLAPSARARSRAACVRRAPPPHALLRYALPAARS